ncbi:MAG TPA: hypothetical protein VGM30_00910 [Puia sp.]|jgi:hypothetical protein
MRRFLIYLISQTILLPIIVGLIRSRRIGKGYQPFYILLWIGLLTEEISYLLITYHHSNTIAINIYTLVEWTLIAWQFHVWGFLKQKTRVFYVLLVAAALFWAIENLAFGKITSFSPYFCSSYAFGIVLLSIRTINFMITHDRNLFRNTRFLICIGFIMYFMYMILYYWASAVSMYGKSVASSTVIFYLMAYINALTNIIYAIAFLLIPARVKFTLK